MTAAAFSLSSAAALCISSDAKIADTTAIRILSEIQAVLQDDDKTDFDVVDEIICIFEKYHICTGTRHDF